MFAPFAIVYLLALIIASVSRVAAQAASIAPPLTSASLATSVPSSSSRWIAARDFASTASIGQLNQDMTGNMTSLKEHLTPELFQGLRDLWFGHLGSEDDCVVAKREHFMPWFAGGDEFDNTCVKRFAPALEAIRASGATTGADILSVVTPTTPLDWLSLVLLLDQIPRNCYRGASASLVFNIFDPLSLSIATEALARGVVSDSPFRWQFTYRMWFYTPMMHSEELEVHKKALVEYQRMVQDVEDLIADTATEGDKEYRAKAAAVVKSDADTARTMMATQLDFEEKHLGVVERFGRYPHRNEALEREPTEEEKTYLENGGLVFGARHS